MMLLMMLMVMMMLLMMIMMMMMMMVTMMLMVMMMMIMMLMVMCVSVSQLAEEAGFPAGVLNTVTCSRDNVNVLTDAVLKSELVTKFSFTGSTATGKVGSHVCRTIIKAVVHTSKMSILQF